MSEDKNVCAKSLSAGRWLCNYCNCSYGRRRDAEICCDWEEIEKDIELGFSD